MRLAVAASAVEISGAGAGCDSPTCVEDTNVHEIMYDNREATRRRLLEIQTVAPLVMKSGVTLTDSGMPRCVGPYTVAVDAMKPGVIVEATPSRRSDYAC